MVRISVAASSIRARMPWRCCSACSTAPFQTPRALSVISVSCCSCAMSDSSKSFHISCTLATVVAHWRAHLAQGTHRFMYGCNSIPLKILFDSLHPCRVVNCLPLTSPSSVKYSG